MYSKYVFDDILVSPINGEKTKRITRANIKRFGFNSMEELEILFPKFPNITLNSVKKRKSVNDKKSQKLILENFHKEVCYNLLPRPCLLCLSAIPFSRRKTNFCSFSCSTSFANSAKGKMKNETKNKIRNSVKKFHIENPKFGTKQGELLKATNKLRKKSTVCKLLKNCVICSCHHSKPSKTCSKKCLSELARNNAIKQVARGGGKHGTYKDIHCDSSYELAFLIYHLDMGHDIKRYVGRRSYTDVNGIDCCYIPDFIVNGLIYEIKGYMSESAIMKHFCNPDIILVNKDDIKPYINYCIKTYDVKDVTELYEKRKIKYCPKCGANHYRVSKYCTSKCAKD